MLPAPPPDILRPIHWRSVAAAVALALNALVALVSSVVGVQRLALIGDLAADPESVDIAEIESTDSIAAAVAVVQSLAYVVAIFAFMIWLYRARKNARVRAKSVECRLII